MTITPKPHRRQFRAQINLQALTSGQKFFLSRGGLHNRLSDAEELPPSAVRGRRRHSVADEAAPPVIDVVTVRNVVVQQVSDLKPAGAGAMNGARRKRHSSDSCKFSMVKNKARLMRSKQTMHLSSDLSRSSLMKEVNQ